MLPSYENIDLSLTCQFYANKSYKTHFFRRLVKQACFEILQQKSSITPRIVWSEKSKTGLGFEIGPPQQQL